MHTIVFTVADQTVCREARDDLCKMPSLQDKESEVCECGFVGQSVRLCQPFNFTRAVCGDFERALESPVQSVQLLSETEVS